MAEDFLKENYGKNKMIIYIRNYFRNKTLNLTVKSIRHFMPDVEINCICFYDNFISEYDNFEKITGVNNILYKKTLYPNTTKLPTESSNCEATSGSLGSRNRVIFTEGYNVIFEEIREIDDKVLLLTEDHFFTTGITLNELTNKTFTLAYAPFGKERAPYWPNASIICIMPKKIQHLFPLSYLHIKDKNDNWSHAIEGHLKKSLIDHISSEKLHIISTRNHHDYKGDGLLTNNYVNIKKSLKEHNII